MIGGYLIACPPLGLPPTGALKKEDVQPGGWNVICLNRNTWTLPELGPGDWTLLAEAPGDWVEIPTVVSPGNECVEGAEQLNCP